jgi:hypothetical protein
MDSNFRNIHYSKHRGNENVYTKDHKVNHNQDWEEKFVVIELLHIILRFKISKTIYSNV